MQNLHKVVWFFCFFFMMMVFPLHASQYGPNMLFQKPYDTGDYIGNFTGTFCAGKTYENYDEFGQIVPFLQNYGKEDILLSFIDATADRNLVEKIGTMDFSGSLHFQCANLSYYKNIMHNMFLGVGTEIQNLDVEILKKNIELTTILNPEQEKKLEAFIDKIPNNLNTSGILSTYLECGYNKKFIELQSMDSWQLFLRGAILTPQWVQGKHLNQLPYTFTGNLTFGYQAIAVIIMQLTELMKIGVFGTVNSFQSREIEVPFNRNVSQNQLLIDEKILINYTPGSVYNGVFYVEFDNFFKNFTLTTAFSFMYGTPRKIKPLLQSESYITAVSDVNLQINGTLHSWNISALFLELDYNFLTPENPQGPCLSLFFSIPISGFNFPKINSIGGAFGLTFNYYI